CGEESGSEEHGRRLLLLGSPGHAELLRRAPRPFVARDLGHDRQAGLDRRAPIAREEELARAPVARLRVEDELGRELLAALDQELPPGNVLAREEARLREEDAARADRDHAARLFGRALHPLDDQRIV